MQWNSDRIHRLKVVQEAQPDYQFSFNNSTFKKAETTYGNLGKGSYLLKILDSHGVTDSVTVTLKEPPPITVDVGPDLTGRLGYEVTLKGSYISSQQIKTIRWIPQTESNAILV